ncbi:GTP cyclohydrolase N terminal-domain-containing protein [Filobasidium floriforme]|uniref:GTP cyclohydrolase N terminal-domain-containing protein n=1 Tax=Filobasidium floriforme TaxID=5210 RepID=UPI001E8D7AED|nr:GTP cyclohydrolase N terminal-domain-containing protein [Filobasidium floriforme]KAH8083731.1 GTP cyclohydrolase N terminal-domain-containing protein [Filobasidium floriforme]
MSSLRSTHSHTHATSTSTMGVLPATTALVDGPFPPGGQGGQGQGVKVLDLEGAAHHVEDLYPDPAVLATYYASPDKSLLKPIPLTWGAPTATSRGPLVVSHKPSAIAYRNAIGAHSGSYSIYRALAMALNTLDPAHVPDYTNTHPPFPVTPNPAWFDPGKIVSLDPWGHLAQTEFEEHNKRGLDVRPTISLTKAHIKMSELDRAYQRGEILPDGKVVHNSLPRESPLGTSKENKDRKEEDAGVEVTTSKAAVEPVWHLPGMAARFGISEDLLRRALFEETGGMYPELITRPDLKVFLPPIGGLTVYIFGNPQHLRDPTKELTLRVHDECNGSDVFGSDICTCRPYLIYGIEEAIKCAQRGGVGLVVYFRKEGRALGEVTKYLVYNSRKRTGDTADRYFKATELIAGVKDMRFQALMPDVLHWLGVQKIDNMISMSDMKHDAIVSSGIPILKRYDIPAELLPPDSQVEIDAKIAAGYFSAQKQVKMEDLHLTVGRAWEDLEH